MKLVYGILIFGIVFLILAIMFYIETESNKNDDKDNESNKDDKNNYDSKK